ncbi:MAG: hypothetical protein IPK99_01345 [Flavobacteriales bacterium]|nr:hypothetical protein [Flavobacteriales bacterium]
MVLLILVHTFVLRWVIVQSTSMFATLVPGDVVAVQRWPVWTGFQRGESRSSAIPRRTICAWVGGNFW